MVVETFVGRASELRSLNNALDKVRQGVNGKHPGACILIRGRRRIGKSTLVEVFVERAKVPYLFYTAAHEPIRGQLRGLVHDADTSTLPDRELLTAASPADWNGAFRVLAAALPDDQPSVVVIDEVPYLMDDEYTFESVLQRAWDRELRRKPVLLILIGSDLSMMEALNTYERPFFQRGTEMVVGPLNPADVGRMLNVGPSDAFDAALVTGGLPLICTEWPEGANVWEFLEQSFADPISALLVSAERTLMAEFPGRNQAYSVLKAVGTGERTFANLARTAGELSATSLQRALVPLIEKRLVAVDLPLSTRPSKDRHYRIADTYLQFWLQFIRRYMPEIERGRGDLVLLEVRERWTTWRGRAIEPMVRDALARLLPDQGLPNVPAVGAYWTRSHDVEIDIVGADREPVAKRIEFVGSVKWRENSGFDGRDLAALTKHRSHLTGDPVPTVAVSRLGLEEGVRPDASYGPEELITAWQRP